jgi:enamine deaminase RidA (YjgF/YER057c/UK114 family)
MFFQVTAMNELISVNGLTVVRASHGAITEYFISARAENPSDSECLLAKMAEFLAEHGAGLVNLRVFAPSTVHKKLIGSDVLKQLDCPVTRLTQKSALGLTIHAHAVAGAAVESVKFSGKVVGRTFEDEHAWYTHLDLVPENTDADNHEQVRELYDRMDAILRSVGLDFSATVRTWLFADQILTWYQGLNEARDTFFAEHQIFNKLVPASTGIGLGNANGAAIVIEAQAVQPLDSQVRLSKVVSPMQCEALDYKSSFSRAALVTAPDHVRMYVSGTASIAPDGTTAYLDDTAKQIELTMQVAEALIRNGGMDWDDTVRTIAYFKDIVDFGLLDDYCKAAKISLPHIKIEADVCRNDLLFEIELDLFKNK